MNGPSSEITVGAASGRSDLDATRSLFREYERAIGIDLCFQGFADELATLPGAYRAPLGGLWLARFGETPVGCVALRPLEPHVGELKRLYLREAVRGRGTGRELVTIVLAHARANGYRRVRLDTLASMTTAIALYRSLGFEEVPAYNENPYAGATYFELALDAPVMHLVARGDWEAAHGTGRYAPPSLAQEGFIHLSTRAQLLRTAERFFAGRDDLLVLVIERAALDGALRFEAADGELFPHLYAELRVDQVREVIPLTRAADGRFAPLAMPHSR